MVNRIVEQMIMFPFEFISPTEFEVEETNTGVAIIKGILLREGVSSNGNLYTIEEMERIAEQAENMPIYVGTATKVDPNLGIKRNNMHSDFEPDRIGRILSAIFDKTKRVIRYIAEIVNTTSHPKMIEEVKAGWGMSIGGIAHKARLVIDQTGKILTKILGMELKHIQLLSPHVKLGQDEARVTDVEVQETMIMYEPIVEVVSINVDGFYGIKIDRN